MQNKVKSDGGPASYYDFKDKYKTLNDVIEEKAEHQWKEYTWQLGNIFKAIWRWDNKDGTTSEYDVKKIIYYGCRIMMRMVGVEKLRAYLFIILNDPQFQDEALDKIGEGDTK